MSDETNLGLVGARQYKRIAALNALRVCARSRMAVRGITAVR